MQTGGSDCGSFAIAFATVIIITPWQKYICIRSSKDETASILVLHEGGIADFPDSKRMTALKYFAHQRCKVLRW